MPALESKFMDIIRHINIYCECKSIITTGLAGGLFWPYKGLLPALSLKTRRMARQPQHHFSAEPLGLFLFALFYRLTRKRVYILFECHLVVLQILFYLILNVLLYLFCIFSYRIHIISSAPEMPVPILIFQVCVSLIDH